MTDMSAFENQFETVPNELYPKLSDEMSNYRFDEVHTLKDRIRAFEERIEYRKETIGHSEQELADIIELEKLVRDYLNEILIRRRPFQDEKTKLANENRDDANQLDALNRELVRLMAEIEAERRLRLERAFLEKATENAPWQKRALKHQFEGAHRMVGAGSSVMGDKPGLGKTLQSIMAIDLLRAKGKGKKVLIFTLKPVLEEFRREIKAWSNNGRRVVVLDMKGKGVKSHVLDALEDVEECIVLTNYEVWRKDRTIIERLKNCRFDTMILDEAHTFKGGTTSTFKGIREIRMAENLCPKCGSHRLIMRRNSYGSSSVTCASCEYRPTDFYEFASVKNVFPMTGTPILNKPSDMWSMLNLIDPKGFPSEEYFLRDFCTQRCRNCGSGLYGCCNERQAVWVFRNGGSERLIGKLGMRFTARDRDSAGVEMPPQDIIHYNLDLDPETYPKQYEFNKILKNTARVKLAEKTITSTQILQWYTWIRQAVVWADAIQIKDEVNGGYIVDHPDVGESIVMDWAEGLVKEAIELKDRIIVVSKFKSGLIEMERRLERDGIRYARFDGDTPDRQRQIVKDDFNQTVTKHGDHKYDVLLLNYAAGGAGLNLHGAQQIVILDREWNPGKEIQMLDRVRRIGSKFATRVHMPHVEGTATDLIDAIQSVKADMTEGFDADVSLAEAMRKFLEN